MNKGKKEERKGWRKQQLKDEMAACVRPSFYNRMRKRNKEGRVQVTQILFHLQLRFLMHHSAEGRFMLYN